MVIAGEIVGMTSSPNDKVVLSGRLADNALPGGAVFTVHK